MGKLSVKTFKDKAEKRILRNHVCAKRDYLKSYVLDDDWVSEFASLVRDKNTLDYSVPYLISTNSVEVAILRFSPRRNTPLVLYLMLNDSVGLGINEFSA